MFFSIKMSIFLHGNLSIRQLPIPPFWRKIPPLTGLEGYVQKRDWQLVLNSQNIEYIICHINRRDYLYVPPLLEGVAKSQLTAYIRENSRAKIPRKVYPVFSNFWPIFIFLAVLAFWHGMRAGWIHYPAFLPNPEAWLDLGKLDSLKIGIYHQFYRYVTALTLHADMAHLAANLFAGCIFLILLARLAGSGLALFLAVIGGMAGNFLNTQFHRGVWQSIGFSTSLFACVGVLAGIMCWRVPNKGKLLLPLGAALSLLAMLGTSGENTDYGAHVGGLAAGLILGILTGWLQQVHLPRLHDVWLFLAAVIIPVCAWFWAFS